MSSQPGPRPRRPRRPCRPRRPQFAVDSLSAQRAPLLSLVLTSLSFHKSLENLLEALGLSPMKRHRCPCTQGWAILGSQAPWSQPVHSAQVKNFCTVRTLCTQSSPKAMSIESVMPSNHLILCHPLLLLPSIFRSIRAKPLTVWITINCGKF